MFLKKMIIFGLLSIILIVSCGKAPEGEFSADMVVSDPDMTVTTKIYVTDSLYRMEQKQADETVVILANERTGFLHAMVPSRKEYLELNIDDPVSLMNDPFQGLKYVISMAESDSLGQDLISGYKCNGYLLKKDDQDLITYWESPKLNFPLKIINHTANSLTLVLKNIKEEKIDRKLLKIPEGYRKMPDPAEVETGIPKWVDKVDLAEIMTPPFEMDLAAADMVRVRVVAGKAVKVQGEGTVDAYAALTAVPFKDGLPINNPSDWTLNLTQFRTGSYTFEETPGEADEIVVRARDGSARIKITHIDIPVGEKIPADKEYRRDIIPNDKFYVRLVNVGEGESSCIMTFMMNGKELPTDVIGPESYRTLVFKEKNDVEIKKYAPPADELVIRVVSGEILVVVRPLE